MGFIFMDSFINGLHNVCEIIESHAFGFHFGFNFLYAEVFQNAKVFLAKRPPDS